MRPRYIGSSNNRSPKRQIGDRPIIGPLQASNEPLARLRESGGIKGRRRQRSSSQRERRKQLRLREKRFAAMVRTSILIAGSAVVMVLGVLMWLDAQGDRKKIATPVAQFLGPDTSYGLGPDDSVWSSMPSDSEALAIIRGALAADSPETLSPYVHSIDEVSLNEMFEFFQQTAERDGDYQSHQIVRSNRNAGIPSKNIALTFQSDEDTHYRIVSIIPRDRNDWRIDFTSYARWCSPPLAQIDSAEGYPGGTVRVLLKPDYYFNGPFSSDREWACYQFANPDAENQGFAYCRIGSDQHQIIESALATGVKPARFTLQIERTDDAQPRQFMVTEVLRNDWLTPHTQHDPLASEQSPDERLPDE